MGGYLGYAEYKDSQTEWLDEIPKHWNINRLRFLLSENFANGIFRKRDFWGAGFKIINVFDVYVDNDVIDESSLDRVACKQDEAEKYSAEHGDFFFVRSSLKLEGIGKSATFLNPTEATVFECHLVRGRPNLQRVNPKFLNYFLNSHLARNLLIAKANQVTMTTLDQSKFKDLPISLPRLTEQQQITDFLDYKTAQIDALIAKKEALLEKLAEKRTALISQAVTKGLDPTVEMKDSGIEWLGAIPEHWQATKLKYYAQCFNGSTPKTTNSNYWEEGTVPWLSSGKVNEDRVTEPSKYVTQQAFEESSLRMVPKRSVIIGIVGQGKTRGTSAYLEIEATINQNMAAMIPNQSLDGRFLHLYLQQAYEPVRNFGRGANQPALDVGLVGTIPIPLAPYEEQVQIVALLETKEAEFRETFQTISDAISRLKEYRTALITNAVTGKIDVRDIKLPEPPSSAVA